MRGIREIRERALVAFLESGERYGELPSFSDKESTYEAGCYQNAAKALEWAYPNISKRLTYCRVQDEDGTYHIYVKRLGLNGGSLTE